MTANTQIGRERRSQDVERLLVGLDGSTLITTELQKPRERTAKVAIYWRVSSIGQADHQNIESQKTQTHYLYKSFFGRDCVEAIAAGEVQVFTDEGYNLEYVDDSREIWKLLKLVEKGAINTIFVASFNRILRSNDKIIQGTVEEHLYRGQALVIETNQPGGIVYDKSDAGGRLINSVNSEIHSGEKISINNRLQNGRRTWLQHNTYTMSRPLYGIGHTVNTAVLRTHPDRVRYFTIEDEAKYVRDIYHLYIGLKTETVPVPQGYTSLGLTTAEIRDHLNSLGLTRQSWLDRQHRKPGKTYKQKPLTPEWTDSHILKILSNPVYRGDLIVVFGEAGQNKNYKAPRVAHNIKIEPVVTVELWEAARAARALRYERLKQKLVSHHPKETYWLNGKVLCATCGNPLRGASGMMHERYYRCAVKREAGSAEHIAIRALDIETILEPRIKEILTSVGSGPKAADNFAKRYLTGVSYQLEIEVTRRAIGENKKNLADLNDGEAKIAIDWSMGKLPREVYDAIAKQNVAPRAALKDKIRELEARIAGRESKERAAADTLNRRQMVEAFFLSGRAARWDIQALRITASFVISSIELVPAPLPDLAMATTDELRRLYALGRIVPKDLANIGWNTRQIYSTFGRSGRKKPLRHLYRVTYTDGSCEVYHPTPSVIPPSVKNYRPGAPSWALQDAPSAFGLSGLPGNLDDLDHTAKASTGVDGESSNLVTNSPSSTYPTYSTVQPAGPNQASSPSWGNKRAKKAISATGCHPEYLDTLAKFNAMADGGETAGAMLARARAASSGND